MCRWPWRRPEVALAWKMSTTRHDSIRTRARVGREFALRLVEAPPMYCTIAPRAAWLRDLGYPDSLIAQCIGVTDKTVPRRFGGSPGRSSAA